jgi:predicted NBD/HSP70 family sugar kinase
MVNFSFLGVDLGGTKMLLFCGEIQEKIPTGKGFSSKDFKTAILDFIQKNQVEIQAVGIAVPGLVQNNQIVECDVLPLLNGFSPEKDWQDFPFQILLSNDIKAALSQEYGEVEDSFTGGVIMVGTGIGAAMIAAGKPILGTDGWAGELGYFPIPHNGKIKRLDELAGGQYMADRLGLTASEMVRKAHEGEIGVLQIIQEGGFTLGLAIAGLINLFNPVEIALGGGTIRLPGYWETMINAIEKHVVPAFWKPGMIRKVSDGEQIVALGAIKRLQLELIDKD